STVTTWPAYGDVNAVGSPLSGTEPCTVPIGSTIGAGFTVTVRLHVADCGDGSLFVARTTTVYVLAAASAPTFSVAVAGLPGVNRETVVALGGGVTGSRAIDAIVPSGSFAESCCDTAVPAVVVMLPPHETVGGWFVTTVVSGVSETLSTPRPSSDPVALKSL